MQLALPTGRVKPCPFCGNPPRVSYQWGSNIAVVECSEARLRCRTGPAVAAQTTEEALRIWNFRPE